MKKKKVLRSCITHARGSEIVHEIISLAENRHAAYICFVNVHMSVEAYKNRAFQGVVNAAALAPPDGRPVATLMNLLYGGRQKRVAGPETMASVLTEANNKKLSVYFYGSTEEVLDEMQAKLSAEYPDVHVAGMKSPPFRPPTPEEEKEDVDTIRSSGAQIVFVGLGCPKQELWMSRHSAQIPAVLLGVGAAFPFFTGQLKRAPLWMQNAGLEWLYRVYAEPRRLFMRYLVTNSLFLILAFRQLVAIRLLGHKSAGC